MLRRLEPELVLQFETKYCKCSNIKLICSLGGRWPCPTWTLTSYTTSGLSFFKSYPWSKERENKRGMRHVVVAKEVDTLFISKFIKEVTYTMWLANIVMVKKSNGKWYIFVDYTDLNNACSKDTYPV